MKKVLMYTTLASPQCQRAKALLQEYGVTPDEIHVDIDRDMVSEMIRRTGRVTVPQIYIGNEYLGSTTELLALHVAGALRDKLGFT